MCWGVCFYGLAYLDMETETEILPFFILYAPVRAYAPLKEKLFIFSLYLL